MGRPQRAPRALAAILLVAFAGLYPVTAAEDGPNKPVEYLRLSEDHGPNKPVKQLQLTETQIKNFIAAQPDLPVIANKLQEAGEKHDAALDAWLDETARKHGFSGFAELDGVAANISLVMAGLDPDTGEFTDPLAALKKELEDVKADASIPEDDKKELVSELTEAIATTAPLQFPENVPLVKAHREEIEKGLE